MQSRIFRNKQELIKELVGAEDVVLDIGFWGQGVGPDNPQWPHRLLMAQAREVWGIDLEYDERAVDDPSRYHRASAESFSLPQRFDVIFAGDLIEHLSNPGLFLDAVRTHLAPKGRLILTTPNAFNLFNITEKLTKDEPTVNSDHTCYFNRKTLLKLLEKNGFRSREVAFLYELGVAYRESWKKKVQNVLYAQLARFTPKFVETLVVVAEAVPKKI